MEREDYDARYDLDPRIEPGTYRRLTDLATQSFTDHPIENLGRRRPSAGQLFAANVAADEESTVFCVWYAELGFFPATHDVVVDALGITWVVRAIEHKLTNTRFHLTCVRIYNP